MTLQRQGRDTASGRFEEEKKPLVTVSARISPDEKSIISQSAQAKGMTAGEYIRWCVQLQ